MAHLHLVSVHPFADGNGRIARIVQSLVLARAGLLAPEFSSIEEYLRRNTTDYHRVLAQVQGGSYQQHATPPPGALLRRRAHPASTRTSEPDRRGRHALGGVGRAPRTSPLARPPVIALEHSLFDGAERKAYAAEAGISLATATTDLRQLADADLVTQQGRTRSTKYIASQMLRRHVSHQTSAEVVQLPARRGR